MTMQYRKKTLIKCTEVHAFTPTNSSTSVHAIILYTALCHVTGIEHPSQAE